MPYQTGRFNQGRMIANLTTLRASSHPSSTTVHSPSTVSGSMTEIKDKLDVHSPTTGKGGRGGVQCPLNSDRNGGRRASGAKRHSVMAWGHFCYPRCILDSP